MTERNDLDIQANNAPEEDIRIELAQATTTEEDQDGEKKAEGEAETEESQAQAQPAIPVEKIDGIDTTKIKATLTAVDGTPIELPEGTELARIDVFGNDLVLVEADGSLILIVGGALNPPTILLGTIEIPAAVLSASLGSGQDIVPAAGPETPQAPESSGQNFVVDPGTVGDPLIANPLLPPTAFDRAFTTTEEFTVLLEDSPSIPPLILDPDGPTVRDPALPSGTESDSDDETATGIVVIEPGSSPIVDIRFGEDLGGIQILDSSGNVILDENGEPVVFNFVPDGEHKILVYVNGDAEPTFEITIDLLSQTEGELQLTLDKAFPHQYGVDGGDFAKVTGIPIEVEDADGNIASDVTMAQINDDLPEAVDDGLFEPAEDTAILIDVFANDVAGADGVDLANDLNVTDGPTKGTLVYHGDGTFTYSPTPGQEGADSFTYEIIDGDGDVSTAVVSLVLPEDSEPTLSVTDGQVNEAALDAGDVAPGDDIGTDPASDAETANGSFTITTGNDTVGSLVIDGVDVTAGGTVNGTYGTLTVINTAGVYTWSYTLDDNTLDHPTNPSTGTSEGIQDDFNVVLTDSDGDIVNDTLTVLVLDDGPTLTVDAATGSDLDGLALEVDETDDAAGTDRYNTGETPDDMNPDGNGAAAGLGQTTTSIGDGGLTSLFGVTDDAGADGEQSLMASLNFVFTEAGPLATNLTATGGNAIELVLSGDGQTITGEDSVTGTPIFTIAIVDVGGGELQLQLTQLEAIDHDALPGGAEDPDLFDEVVDLLLSGDGAVQLEYEVTLVDGDNDSITQADQIDLITDTDSFFSFDDDGPAQNAGTLSDTVHEDALDNFILGNLPIEGSKGNDEGGKITTAVFTHAMLATLVNFGSDGAAAFTLNTAALDDTPINGVTSQGKTLEWKVDGGELQGVSEDGRVIFTVSQTAGDGTADLTDDEFTFELLDQVDHPNASGDDDQSVVIDVSSAFIATDGDGDQIVLDGGSLTVAIENDVPIVVAKSDLYFSNSGSVSGTGVFEYSIGADERTNYSESNSDFSAIALSGTVAGVAIESPAVTWVSEDSASAVFSVAFDYEGTTGTATATGTLTFDKDDGTYTLALDAPIESLSITSVSSALGIQGYEPETSTFDNTQPDVATAQLSTDLFVQFTGFSEPGSGTGANNLEAGTTDPGVFTDGELLSQDSEWVSISGDANGVGGDTMGKGEVLDFNLYTTDPTGFTTNTVDGQASTLFFKLDGIGNNEDFIVILKLVDPDTLATTTKAILVENGDMYKGAGTGPGIFSDITLDNNDALVIIEPDDYNSGGENWVIQGAQITTTDEGITGTLIDLEGDIGVASTGTQYWSDDTNDTGFKFSDIGFVSTGSVAQDAELTFEFNIVDADGDATSQQTLDVNIIGGDTFVGTAADETFITGPGADEVTGGGGLDTFVIDADVLADSNLGDLISDYNLADADVLDLTEIFATMDGPDNAGEVDGLVSLASNGTGGTIVSVDADGEGAGTDFVEVVELSTAPVSVNVLWDNAEAPVTDVT